MEGTVSFLSMENLTHRRGFLGRLAAGTLAITGAGLAGKRGLAQAAEPEEIEGADDWLSGVNGTHRQFFDGVTINDGFAFGFAMNFLDTIGPTYKTTDKDISVVVGLRHFAIPLVFNNDIW